MTQSTVLRLRNMELPADLTQQLVQRMEQDLSPSVKTDYLLSSVLTKYVSDQTDPPITRRTRAINKWLAAERDNEATNERLFLTHEEYNILPRVSFERFVSCCRDLITEIIGETVPLDALIGTFSGGASTSRSRTKSHPSSKYVGKAHVTAEALDWFNLLQEELPLWLGRETPLRFEVVPGNVMFTVPKNTEIDRVACKEPDINMFLQKGVGNFVRSRLRRIGINLNDQSVNRSLAQKGSVDGSLATLDLSSASDSMTEGLVSLLLPVCWYSCLDALRCPVTVIDGEKHRNQMFSSMGNGFTFELESLLFYVLTRVTARLTGTPGSISVYGDDIICPAGMSSDLTTVLSYFGFQVNTKKSFTEGPFRESCGGHYYNGRDVTPFYVREPIRTLDHLIDVANKLRKWGDLEQVGIIDPQVRPTWAWLASFVPRSLWGGEDLDFKYQLVSQDTPQLRLSPKRGKKRHTALGGYLHWHNATWDRTNIHDGVQTSSLSPPAVKLEVKKVRKSTVPRLSSVFLEELA